MKRICLGISKSKMSRCWASEKVPWQWGSLREALKVTRTLTTGRPGERAPAPLVGLDSDQSDNEQGGGSGTHSPWSLPPTGTAQGRLQTLERWVGEGQEPCQLGSSERQDREGSRKMSA